MKPVSSLNASSNLQAIPKTIADKEPVAKGLNAQTEKQCHQIQKKIELNSNKKPSFFKRIKSCLSLPIAILLWYFTFEMLFFASLELIIDIYSAFENFFSRLKNIFQQNSLFLLFWAVIIIKTKLPQLQRLFYHTIVKSILQNEETQCSICLNQDCDYIMPKCSHQYHALCLEKWLKSQACCPYCRTKTQKNIVRKIPWRLFFQSIVNNKVKWLVIIIVCLFVQYRLTEYNLFFVSGRQKAADSTK